MRISRQAARRAAVLLLAAFVTELIAALCGSAPLLRAEMLVLMAAAYGMNAVAAYWLKSWTALAASLAGCALAVLLPGGTNPAWIGNITVNLLYLAIYLPMQAALGRSLGEADVSRGTLTLGRRWAVTLLVGRFLSSAAYLLSELYGVQQGSRLFGLQLVLEIAALVAVFASYVYMVRYLWRARTLLAEQEGL
ncbi:MAG: hypothetical protein Q4C72_05185 [Eubacteriales bacterium]|nr:hypothetical protein [Eubacteriales bacterium]